MNKVLSTWFGLGFLPKAPGTWGSGFPLAVVLGCGHFGCNPFILCITLILLFMVSSIATLTAFDWYSNHFGIHDPGVVVSDEVAGQSLALLGMAWLVPESQVSIPTWIGLAVLSFMLFRVFDIWKCGPIGKVQQLQRGTGVLLDDILAGAVAGLITVILSLLLIE